MLQINKKFISDVVELFYKCVFAYPNVRYQFCYFIIIYCIYVFILYYLLYHLYINTRPGGPLKVTRLVGGGNIAPPYIS